MWDNIPDTSTTTTTEIKIESPSSKEASQNPNCESILISALVDDLKHMYMHHNKMYV